MNKNPIFIFDSKDKLLAITTSYSEALYEESIDNKGATLEVIYPANEEHAEYLVGGNQVAFRDLEGRFRLFTIREVDDEDGASFEKVVICLPAMDELEDAIIENQIPQDKDASFIITNLLANTRWLVGNIAALGLNSTSFYYLNVKHSLLQTASIWGGELIDRVELDDTGISGRYIDLVFRRGADKGKRFEIDKDIESITRTVLYYPKTALYGRGSSIEVGEGNSRRITFDNVVWSVANGDPTDKPVGQKWVGDPDALLIHGIGNDGEKIHRFGQFEDNDEELDTELLKKTWAQLQSEKVIKARYKMTVNTFYGISGYEHEQVLLGDTGAIIDNNLKPEILIESRVISMKYDIGDPANGEVVIGNFLDFNKDQDKLDWVIEKVSEGSGQWDAEQPPQVIDDTSFVDTVPPVPTNIQVNGLFRLVQMLWDYVPSSFIGAYEVYGSQVPGFVPDPSNLLFRGKTGGFVHDAETNQMWYYRFRSINTHGTPSAYSVEFSAQTARIDLGEVAPGVITGTEISDNAITTPKIAAYAITAGTIEAGAITTIKLAAGAVTADKIFAGSITSDKIVVAGLDAAVIKFGTMSGSRIQAYTITADRLNVSSLDAITGTIGFLTSGTIDVSQAGITSAGSLSSSTRFWAGASYGNKDFAPFRVDQSGKVYASNVDITGGSINISGNAKVGKVLTVGTYQSGSDASLSVGGGLYISSDGWNGTIVTGQDLDLRSGHDVYLSPMSTIDGKVKIAHNGEAYDPFFEFWRVSSSVSELSTVGRRLQIKAHTGGIELFGASDNSTYIRGLIGSTASSILKWSPTGLQVRTNSDGAFASISASAFFVNSLRESKRNITKYEDDALNEIMTTPVHRYNMNEDLDTELKRVGLIFDEVPVDIADINGFGIDIYSMASLLWRSVQQLNDKINVLENKSKGKEVPLNDNAN